MLLQSKMSLAFASSQKEIKIEKRTGWIDCDSKKQEKD